MLPEIKNSPSKLQSSEQIFKIIQRNPALLIRELESDDFHSTRNYHNFTTKTLKPINKQKSFNITKHLQLFSPPHRPKLLDPVYFKTKIHTQNNSPTGSQCGDMQSLIQSRNHSQIRKSMMNKSYQLSKPSKLDLIALQRDHLLSKANKWDDFREKRAKIVDLYLVQRKKQHLINVYLKQLFMHKMVQKCFQNLLDEKTYRKKQNEKIFTALSIKAKMKKHQKRYGKEIEIRLKNRVRVGITFIGLIKYKDQKEKALGVLKGFLKNFLNISNRIEKVLDLHTRIVLFQKFIRAQQATRYGKAEVLVNYWDKLVKTFPPNQIKDFITIKYEVKTHILKQFIKQCRKLQSVAFYQWRLKYRSKNKETIEELIDNSYGHLKQDSRIYLNNYTQNSYLINNFECIGWQDPFDIQNDLVEVGPFDLVYPPQRYVDEHSPFCIYMPSRDVMLKIMKACVGCLEIQQLWIYN